MVALQLGQLEHSQSVYLRGSLRVVVHGFTVHALDPKVEQESNF